MNKLLNFLTFVFFVVGLVVPSSFVFAQDPGTSPAPTDTAAAPPALSPASSPATSPAETKPTEPTTTQPVQSPVTSPPPTEPTSACPPKVAPPTCAPGESLKTAVDDRGCSISQYCVKLEGGEQPRSCSLIPREAFDDCRNSGGNPVTQTGPDNCAILKCERQEGQQLKIPDGCREEVDPQTGYKRFTCTNLQEQKCPATFEQDSQKSKCQAEGGSPVAFQDPSGCTFYDCKFQQRAPQSQSRAFSGGGKALGLEKRDCPVRKQAEEEFKKCQSVGQEGFYVGPPDCRFVECRNVEARKNQFRCDEGRNFAHLDDLIKKCGGEQNIVEDFDASGCKFPRCAKEKEERGPRGPPPEFFERCTREGGKIADFGEGKVKCVPPKSKSKAEKGSRQDEVLALAEIKEGDILKLGIKFEKAKVALNEAKKELENLANYWEKEGSPKEAERIMRAARILGKNNERLQKITKRLAANVKDLNLDDLLSIKEDVVIAIERIEIDATSALLGGDVEEAPEGDIDTEELEENAELCIVGKFNVDTGEEGPEITVDIKGIDDDGDCNGSMKVSFAKSSFKPPIPEVTEATCKDIDVLASSTSGDRPPSKEELAEAGCKGTFVDNLDKMMPGIPGKCQGEECKDYCGTSETAAKECLAAFKDFLPPDAKVGLTLMSALGGSPDGIRQGFEKAFSGGQAGAKEFLAKIESALSSAGIKLDEIPGDMKQGIEMLKSLAEGKLPSFGPGGFGGEGGPEFGFGGFGGEEEDHSFVGPGGCSGPAECEAYCSKNPEDCKQAFGREEGGERVRDQFGREFRVNANDCPPGEYPGKNDKGEQSCIRPESGSREFSQPRNFERFKQDQSRFVGPGGCTTKAECEAQFRNNPEAFKSSFGSEFRPPPGFDEGLKGEVDRRGVQPPSGFDSGNFRPPEGGNYPPPGDYGNFRPPEGSGFNQPPGGFQPPSGGNYPPPGDYGNYQPPSGGGGFSQPPSGAFVSRR